MEVEGDLVTRDVAGMRLYLVGRSEAHAVARTSALARTRDILELIPQYLVKETSPVSLIIMTMLVSFNLTTTYFQL